MFRIGSVSGKGKRGKALPMLTGGEEWFDYDPVDRAALRIAVVHHKGS
ncbi:hypothetical protein R69658_05372 [Paraburkholderia aspalathi]|uniref:Transposase n=1 Tax=Paraburkholderia aspalathi TaxID=1324617 RepID=A0ABN7MJD7_9BURK|nr:hypothetical protein R69658_05372 [Paraburkholderia aspalathi]